MGDVLHQIGENTLLWAPLVFFAIIVYLLWRTVQLMPRVKPNLVQPNSRSSVKWADVAGAEEAKAELQEVVDFLRDPARFARLGARVPKGILLYGPPGTGKTLLAKAVAHESGASFYSQSASAFVEMFAGLGAARIRKLFDTARRNAPAIVFIDELDAVGAARTGHGFNREQDQTLNQLLVELDGFGRRDQVVVMGASNRSRTSTRRCCAPAASTARCSSPARPRRPRGDPAGAHARQAARRGRRPRTARAPDLGPDRRRPREHRQRGGDLRRPPAAPVHPPRRLRGGPGARRRRHAAAPVVTEKEKRILAYHEAGHALMSHLVGDAMPVQKVTIVARGQALGYTLNMPAEDRYLHTRRSSSTC